MRTRTVSNVLECKEAQGKRGFQKEKVVRGSTSRGPSRGTNPTAARGLRNSEVMEDSGEEGSTK